MVYLSVRKLRLEIAFETKRVNLWGGANALVHPRGATGARTMAILLNGLEQQALQTGIVSMCTETGWKWRGYLLRSRTSALSNAIDPATDMQFQES